MKRHRKRAAHRREHAGLERKAQIRAQGKRSTEHEAVTQREQVVERARGELEAAKNDRERLLVQMREANERLVAATLHADELVEGAMADRELASDAARIQAQARQRAEALARQLLATTTELRASARDAVASNRAKDEFLAMLAHELRSPLAPIMLALDLIALDAMDAHQREHTIIERQVKQLARLVDDLLDISRIRSGKIELRREPLELAEVVARAVETAAPLIAERHHTLTVDVPQAGLGIDGDLSRLIQVVANLLTNAAKYTTPGGAITVIGERQGPSVVLRVRDTGIGISPTMLPRIFDLFAQETVRSSGRSPGGLGLGLAIVRSIIALHGGTVTAFSEGLGHGSEVVIELPARVAGSSSEPALGQPAVESPSVVRKLLIVDDNPLVADLLALALTRVGHDVRVALDGATALSTIDQFVPDIVLLDIDLPDIDGYEVAKRLRAALSPRTVRFFAITGHGQSVDRQRSADAGFDEHLVKPVDLATLQDRIATHG